jgi:hypothetical protein
MFPTIPGRPCVASCAFVTAARYASAAYIARHVPVHRIAAVQPRARGDAIGLLTLYAKSAQENTASATLRMLRRMVDHAEIE